MRKILQVFEKLQRFKNIKIYKEMYGEVDTSELNIHFFVNFVFLSDVSSLIFKGLFSNWFSTAWFWVFGLSVKWRIIGYQSRLVSNVRYDTSAAGLEFTSIGHAAVPNALVAIIPRSWIIALSYSCKSTLITVFTAISPGTPSSPLAINRCWRKIIKSTFDSCVNNKPYITTNTWGIFFFVMLSLLA